VTIFLLKSVLSFLLLRPQPTACMPCTLSRPYTGRRSCGIAQAAPPRGRIPLRHPLSDHMLPLRRVRGGRQDRAIPRASLHILVALAIAALLMVKVLFLRLFRHFYEQAKIIGTVIGVLSFVLVGISAGYFLAVSRLGQDRTMDRSAGTRCAVRSSR